ncbi:MAG: DUF2059 domain-containing protein [Chthoniobacterales bacterium]
MKKPTLFCILILMGIAVLTPQKLYAQDTPHQVSSQGSVAPEKMALSEELLGLFEMDKAFDEYFDQVAQLQKANLARSNMSPQEMAKQAKILQETLDETRKIFNWNIVKGSFIKIYAGLFTQDELRGMVDFFKSPVGAGFIKKQSEVQAAMVQKMQEVASQIEPKIEAAMQKARAGAQASPTPPASAPSTKKHP